MQQFKCTSSIMAFNCQLFITVGCCLCKLFAAAATTATTTTTTTVCNGTDIDYIANNLQVTVEVIANYNATSNSSTGRLTARLNLTNTGTQQITRTVDWQIYLSSIRDMDLTSNGTTLGHTGLMVYHVNGVLHRIVPTTEFIDLNPGQTLNVVFEASDWMVARTDLMPNWYVVQRDCPLTARTITSTADLQLSFVFPFTRSEQWKRAPEDQYNPYTPQYRYELDLVDNEGAESVKWKVLPTPVELFVTDTSTTVNILTDGWVVIEPLQTQLTQEAHYLAELLNLAVVESSNSPAARRITINLSTVDGSNSTEAYTLTVNTLTELIVINGSSPGGVFYGIQTLASLCSVDGKLPALSVSDWPRYQHRGLSVDVARNFHSDVANIKTLLDAMAMYKFNRLHLHLSDDEAWRLEIPGLDELTTVGARRCHDLSETQCILSQLGSGPTQSNSGTGHYSTADYRDILAYAEQRHILVIPEFDMPGHGHAAIAAMLARYKLTNDASYLLSDLADKSVYRSVQGFTDNAINPCINSTYMFIEHVVSQLVEMHRGIQNLTIFHFGGDEVPSTAWTASPACDQFRVSLSKPNATSADFKEYFVKRVSDICKQYGVNMACWEDGLYAGSAIINKSTLATDETYANVWNNVWEWGSGRNAYDLANSHYKVILSHATHLYFDFSYEPDPEERGFYWATRYVSLKKVFSFQPDSVYNNMDVDVMGRPINKTNVCVLYGCPPLTQPQNIIGMQGQLWSETVRLPDNFEYMMFPRLLALAERSWHRADWEQQSTTNAESSLDEDWTTFVNILGHRELRRLDQLHIRYRVPPPGARLTSTNSLDVTTELPGLQVRYSVNNGSTWCDYEPAVKLEPGQTVQLVALSVDRSRTSCVVSLVVPASVEVNVACQSTTTHTLLQTLFIVFIVLVAY